MLIALKMNSMRAADKRDIIMLCYDKPEVGKILRHLKKAPKEKIRENIGELKLVLLEPEPADSMIQCHLPYRLNLYGHATDIF